MATTAALRLVNQRIDYWSSEGWPQPAVERAAVYYLSWLEGEVGHDARQAEERVAALLGGKH